MKTPISETWRRGGECEIGSSSDRVIVFKAAASFGHFFFTLRAAVREIFDESAYERYLAHTHLERSVASYREFLREREDAFSRKPRCC
ncbi:MAG TPA: YbdD/YjiX family protein [Terriglobales bacterium]|nr:YbdD/YjiX family protein [Terriglobales bacterium]